MKEMRLIVMLTILLGASGAIAQTATTDQTGTDTDIALLRTDVQAQKTDVIAHTMQFNDTDAKVFWPLYREYAQAANHRRSAREPDQGLCLALRHH